MSDIFKSAFGYLNANNGTQPTDNDFVGQIVEIGNIKLTVKRVIAEGGFAFVYAVLDPNSGKEYALKRLLAADKEANALVLNELNILKQLSGHPNIIQYLAAAALERPGLGSEYLLLTELCPRSLINCLGPTPAPLSPDVVARIFWQTCKAVHHMHSQVPPVIHRDLKLENLLISNDGVIKLCDFGSCTIKCVRPDDSWTAPHRAWLEDQMAQCTTPMYRAPEMVDTWSNFAIGLPADVWALGCLLYTLSYATHPFADSAKLKILNANYTIPPGDTKYAPFHDIIRGCLLADPSRRLTVSEILDRLSAINETLGFDMRAPLQLSSKPRTPEATAAPSRPPPPSAPPSRPAPPAPAPTRPLPPTQRPTETPQQAGLFSSIKGGAGSFLKNLKTTSSKVISTVQQSIARQELDVSYITSRVMVMPFPADSLELASAGCRVNHVDDVKEFIAARYPAGRYSVYNLSGKSYPPTKLGSGRVVDVSFGGFRRVAPLPALYHACADIMAFLERDGRHAVILHGTDGKAAPAVLVSALLMYAGVMARWQDALQMFAVKRMPPELQPSDIRYLEYMNSIVGPGPSPSLPHHLPVTIGTITLSPVPLFTKLRDGCRPYVEVYQGDDRVKSTLTDYERMRVYHVSEGKVVLTVNAAVLGDVTIGVYHARQNLGGVMSSGRPTGHRIAQIQFHTGFIAPQQTSLTYNRCELDEPAEADHYLDGFRVTMEIQMGRDTGQARSAPWDTTRRADPQHLFANTLEMEETIENFGSKPAPHPKSRRPDVAPPRPVRPPVPSGPAEPVVPQEDFVSIPTEAPPQPLQRKRQESVDLLGLGEDIRPEPVTTNTTNPKPMNDLDSLFGGAPNASTFNAFGGQPAAPQQFVQPQPPSNFGPPPNFPSSASKISPSQSKSGLDDLMFDPFGASAPPPQSAGFPRNASSSNLENRNKDPFADLGNLGANLNIPSMTPSASKSGSPMNGTPVGTPNVQSPMHRPTHTPNNEPSLAKSPVNSDYSRSHFDAMNKKAAEPSKPADIFGDLLGSQGYGFAAKKDSGPRTMNQLRKEEMVKELDPDRVKILEWTEGKKGNIRALLCSMNHVIWEDCKWKGIDMSQLVSAADVKKAYRKACLAVHPDKQVGTEQETMAKMIFIELNNAWSDFESDASQQNLF